MEAEKASAAAATPAWKYTGERLTHALVADVARILDLAGIPNILWGDFLLTVWGVNSYYIDAGFVVADEQLTTAISVLYDAGFTACPDLEDCRATTKKGCSPAPPAHAHLESGEYISLYTKSETLWNIPSSAIPAPHQEPTKDIYFSNDSRLPSPGWKIDRGHGAFPDGLYPVRIPSAERLTEAWILLLQKWADHDFYSLFYVHMLLYMERFMRKDGLVDIDQLEPRHSNFIKTWEAGNGGFMKLLYMLED